MPSSAFRDFREFHDEPDATLLPVPEILPGPVDEPETPVRYHLLEHRRRRWARLAARH